MVELRKRKTPPPPAAAPTRKKSATSKKANTNANAVADMDQLPEKAATVAASSDPVPAPSAAAALSSPIGAPILGNTITLEGFGGEVETDDGSKVTLQKLVEESKTGVVIFTYPKASTPGCTTQVCLFRDSYTSLTSTGLSIYGLSSDSPKSNSTFKTKQNLPYTLLCDPRGTLLKAMGMHKPPKGTKRGVFVVDKAGKVLAVETGGPAATVQVVQKLVGQGETAPEEAGEVGKEGGQSQVEKQIEEGKVSAMEVDANEEGQGQEGGLEKVPTQEDKEKAAVAAEVAITAEMLDRYGVQGSLERMPTQEDKEKAAVAAEVANTAEMLDRNGEEGSLERVPTQEDKEKAEIAAEVANTAEMLDKDEADGPA